MAVLVTGGAGYIGSHTVVELQNAGYDVVVLDNLSNASEKALDRVSKITGKPVKFYKADILDRDALNDIFDSTDSRIIIATFASNIYRLKHIVDTCYKRGRKIAIFGRSMENNIEISIEGGYIKHKDIFITPEEANKLPNNKVCLLCTGCCPYRAQC